MEMVLQAIDLSFLGKDCVLIPSRYRLDSARSSAWPFLKIPAFFPVISK